MQKNSKLLEYNELISIIIIRNEKRKYKPTKLIVTNFE